MAHLSGKNNNFKFIFPKVFVPQMIEEKYTPLLNRIPGNMCSNVIDFINFNIMSVELEVSPAEYEPIEQVDRATPYGRVSRSDAFPDFLWKKNMVITFQLDSTYIIWSILTDLFTYYYCTKEKFLPVTPGMEILDCQNKVIYRIQFENMLFTGVSSLEFNFSSNEIDQKTITTNWVANKVDVIFEPSKI